MSTTIASASLAAMATLTPMLTTTFVPTATTCTQNRLTMLENRGYEIWMNMPVPVQGTTFSDCYPSQFMTSYLLSAGGVTQPAFNPLICPENYDAVGPYTSNYIACCPSGYSFAQPTVSGPSDRPAYGGTCYTPIPEATPVVVTAYGPSGVTATTTFSATVTNAQAYALVIEGFAYGVAEVASVVPTVSASTTSASTSSGAASATGALSASNSSSSNSTLPYVAANNSNALKIGLGVGLSVFALMLLSLGIFCLRRKWRTRPADVNFETSPLSKSAPASQWVYDSKHIPPPSKVHELPYQPIKDAHELHEYTSPTAPTELEGSMAYELQSGRKF